ncbi:MAG: hypothetical protein AVDCRST_MAG53-1130, partial [uncultured Solirubrobacteraceae bacterium]
ETENRPDRRRRAVHPQAHRHHAGRRRGLRAAPGRRRAGSDRDRHRLAAEPGLPRREHAQARRHRRVPRPARPAGGRGRDHRHAHRGGPRRRARRARGGCRPLFDQAVLAAGPAAPGRRDRRRGRGL